MNAPRNEEGRLAGRPDPATYVAQQLDLNSTEARDLQRWMDGLLAAIKAHRYRQRRRTEGFQAIDGAAVFK